MVRDFTKSAHCISQATGVPHGTHCASCRSSAGWREKVGAPEVCPFGFTAEHLPDRRIQQSAIPATHGAGTELKKILERFGIKPIANCKCNARAREMDDRGIDWCRDNMELILDWLKEESERRKLIFFRPLARKIVRLAIHNAKAAENN